MKKLDYQKELQYNFYKFLVALTLPAVLIMLIMLLETGRSAYVVPLYVMGCLFVYSAIVLSLVVNSLYLGRF